MDAAYLGNKYVAPIGYDAWRNLRRLVDWVAGNWDREDEGVWEVRGGRRHFVYSKFMCWVALDCGLRLADKCSFPADRAAWLKARDAIYEEVMAKGWSESRGSFVQSYGSDALDASALLMPLTFFMAPNDPRMLATVDAIRSAATKGGLAADGLVYRYDPSAAPDGLPVVEGTFNMCSFWLVEALTRAGRTDPARLAEARLLFEQMLGYGNHLGLYAEQTGPSGEALGNFPQAFTHLADQRRLQPRPGPRRPGRMRAAVTWPGCPGPHPPRATHAHHRKSPVLRCPAPRPAQPSSTRAGRSPAAMTGGRACAHELVSGKPAGGRPVCRRTFDAMFLLRQTTFVFQRPFRNM
jgi:hypothetical protein